MAVRVGGSLAPVTQLRLQRPWQHTRSSLNAEDSVSISTRSTTNMKALRSLQSLVLVTLLAAPVVAQQPAPAIPGAAATKPIATSIAATSENGSALLRVLALASTDAASALASDDFAAYKKQLPPLLTALVSYMAGVQGPAGAALQNFKDRLEAPAEINAARRAFEPFSSAVADLAQEDGVVAAEKLYVYECGMAPVGGKARWLQRASGARNPFYGAKMLRCGAEITGPRKTASAPVDASGKGSALVLPPGHPPIDQVSVAAYLRAQGMANAASKSAPAGSCGSCGMSQAAMAAGEPCEHGKK